jgi:membrane associated rhomboid family serine protease
MRLRQNLATQYLVIVISLFYFADAYIFPSLQPRISDYLSLFKNAAYPYGDLTPHGVDNGEWWRLVTVVLTHASLLHLATNMLSLWLVGGQFETLASKTKLLILFFGSAIISSFASLPFMAANQVAVGASGAIFGVFGGLIVYAQMSGIRVQYSQVMGTLVLNAIITFTVPGIDWQAHVGGLVGGAIIGFFLALNKRKPKSDPWKTSWESDLS